MMMTAFRMFAGLLAVVFVAFPTQASGSGGATSGPSNRIQATFTVEQDHEDGGVDGHTGFEEAGPRAVNIPTLVLPAFAVDRLAGYLFVDVRVIVAEGADPWEVRGKAHRIRDALIRAGHRRSVADVNNPRRIDADRAREILSEGMIEIIPAEDIERLEFTHVAAHAG